ncbi:hypothetical protein AC249_AIPGENE13880 [Exaiptasia diaphana]|nr:hypothetical protein AC249_AIPGENE13880 [Exaiptasia diaphana]
MNWNFPLLLLVVVFSISLPSEGLSQKCASMVGTPLQRCNVAGYNSTFPIPFKMKNQTKKWVKMFLDYAVKMSESNNCSSELQSMGEMITCAIYVPRCRKGDLFLPCRRVCAEFFKKCDGHIDPFWFDYFIAFCPMLPDFKASSGRCFEPPNFDKNFNDTGTEPERYLKRKSMAFELQPINYLD